METAATNWQWTLKISVTPKESTFLGGSGEGFGLCVDLNNIDLTWVELLQKNVKNDRWLLRCFQKILFMRDEYTIKDFRHGSSKKIWGLGSTVREFVESFGKKLNVYKARLGRQPASTPEPTGNVSEEETRGGHQVPPAIASTSRQAIAADVKVSPAPRLSQPVTDGSNASGMAPPPAGHPRGKRAPSGNSAPEGVAKRSKMSNAVRSVDLGNSEDSDVGSNQGPVPDGGSGSRQNPSSAPVQVEMERDEVASIVESNWSQDSQLEELGTEGGGANKAVKANFLTSVNTRVTNSSMVLIKEELKELDRCGKLCQLGIRYFPRTLALLNLLKDDPPQ